VPATTRTYTQGPSPRLRRTAAARLTRPWSSGVPEALDVCRQGADM
jgi:hypothetical protein